MINTMLINALLLVQTCLLGAIVYAFLRIRVRVLRYIRLFQMDVEEILKLVSDEINCPKMAAHTSQDDTQTSIVSQKREKLAAVIAGGQAERWLGRVITIEQLDKLSNTEVEKYFARYEMCMGASMASSIGQSILAIHGDLAARIEPDLDQASLTAELGSNPYIEHSLSTVNCKLFYTFGWYLAPLVAAYITIKHIRQAQMRRLARNGAAANGEEPTES